MFLVLVLPETLMFWLWMSSNLSRTVLIWKIRDLNWIVSKGSISWVSQETEIISYFNRGQCKELLGRHWRKSQGKTKFREQPPQEATIPMKAAGKKGKRWASLRQKPGLLRRGAVQLVPASLRGTISPVLGILEKLPAAINTATCMSCHCRKTWSERCRWEQSN